MPPSSDARVGVTTPIFFDYLQNITYAWQNRFFQECELLAQTRPEMDGDELETLAAERTTTYYYYLAKERLKLYKKIISWRVGLE